MINNCTHPKEKQSLVVTEGFANYEITRVLCGDCKEFITDPKTDF
ncbi:hypothetical protein [Tenacibaculum haliotis]|nr:hypothetical protein [Tenacibaculum haliotis]MCT4698478.1 hypothetical protein [Tenacibaculum haliotis]